MSQNRFICVADEAIKRLGASGVSRGFSEGWIRSAGATLVHGQEKLLLWISRPSSGDDVTDSVDLPRRLLAVPPWSKTKC